MSDTRLKSDTYCQILVSPGIGATLQLFFEIKVLMTEDLPVDNYFQNVKIRKCMYLIRPQKLVF